MCFGVRKISLKINHPLTRRSIGQRLRIQPVHQPIFQSEGEQMIAGGTVVADEVAIHVGGWGESKIGEVLLVFLLGFGDQFFRRNAFLLCAQHDRSSMRVVRTYVVALMPAHFLKTRPDIGLQILYKVADMDRAIGVGQCAGN